MDTLALLCNLYGDGPQTLRRLREAGCATLSALETLECERLATLLRTSVRSAKRFKSEGRLLRERSELSGERASARRPSEPPAALPVAPKNALVASVLSAWRERDARAGDGQPSGGSALAVEVPRAPAAEPREGLEGLDGMDAALLSRLRESGVTTLDALREVDVLDLAGRGIAGFTRLLHLQFLARRAPEGRKGAAGVENPARGEPTTAAPATHPAHESVAAGQDIGTPSISGAELHAGTPEATPFAAGISLEGAATGARDDVLVPVRAQERRGSLRSAAFPAAPVAVRFSPRFEPQMALPLPLEADLQRHAAARRNEEALGSGTAAQDEAGSSGPFA